MDMVSMNALSTCNRACYDKISEVLHAVATSSESGIVLVMHVDEDAIDPSCSNTVRMCLQLPTAAAIRRKARGVSCQRAALDR